MLSIRKTLNIILVCFDGKKQPFMKNRRVSTARVIKKFQKNQKLIFFFDDAIQLLLSSALQFKFKCAYEGVS